MVIVDGYPTAWGRGGSRRKRLTSSYSPTFSSAKQNQRDEIEGNSASDGHLPDTKRSETAVEFAVFHNVQWGEFQKKRKGNGRTRTHER